MTTNEIPNPLPEHVMVVDDDGTPTAVVNVDQMQINAVTLAYDMARHCGDHDALDQVSAEWLTKIGPDGFGYAAAGALRIIAEHILDPALIVLEQVAPQIKMRDMLTDAYRNAAGETGR